MTLIRRVAHLHQLKTCVRASTSVNTYRSKGQRENQMHVNDLQTYMFLGIFTAVGGCTYTLENDQANCDSTGNPKVDETTEKFKPKLSKVRKRIREEFRLPEYVQDRKVSISVSPEGTICVSFSVPQHANIISTIVVLLESLNAEEIKIDTSNGKDVLGMAFANGKGSILVKSPEAGKRGEIMFFKDGYLDDYEVDAIVNAYEHNVRNSVEASSRASGFPHFLGPLQEEGRIKSSPDGQVKSGYSNPEEQLTQLGAKVYMPNRQDNKNKELTWDSLAGYEKVKRDIEDTILLAVKHPDEYERIAKGTRMVYEKSKVRAVLFEGPPGCGKTSTARILSSIAGMPMVYVPVEAIMSKYFGESENRLSEIFKTCEKLGPCIVFLDEIDSLATSRDVSSMHEATRRILSVLLRSLDGFEQNSKSIVIAATNRKSDLDAALISRFNLSITFELPDLETRAQIFKRYAKQLDESELQDLAQQSHGFSGRDVKDVCELAERRWASKRIRKLKEAMSSETPPFEEYQNALSSKQGSELEMGSTAL